MIRLIYAFVLTLFLILIPLFGVGILGLTRFFSIVIPYSAFLIFLAGSILRVLSWVSSPQPFKIPLTAGQQRSLQWIKSSYIESPYNKIGIFMRMLLEILFFRSLLKNEKTNPHVSKWLLFTSNKRFWLMSILFHYSLLIIVFRHLKLFFEPIPSIVNLLSRIDALFEISIPTILLTEIIVLVCIAYLLLRRIVVSQVRYISLTSDYFVLFLLLSVVLTGILLRHLFRVDIMDVKRFALGLFLFNPYIPHFVGSCFYVHLFLVSFLFAYFPFSKLVHAGGVFLSPTRNLENNSRTIRYLNPWNYPVKTRTYDEWEDEFREMMKEANIPVEKEDRKI
ncbi:MAG: sulfate reduction electron transfer complex DsrMKJOP subunit DsrM [Deltaproteobacteria bacterium]|nr:sulfate reduction electron transfer complex DsrMKJOP subunit DsrM [Deltaproteobacteria bacterium]